MVSWYKHDIPAWMNGTECLSSEAYRIYHMAIQLIYLNEGPISFTENGMAGRCCMHVLTFRAHFKKLIAAGKLKLQDGKLSNERCEIELAAILEKRKISARGGRGSAEVRARSAGGPTEVGQRLEGGPTEVGQRSEVGLVKNLNKNNGTAQVLLINGFNHKSREEKTRVEKKESCRVSDETPTKSPAKIYSEDFETNFWKPFPRTAIMSKKEAWREWMKLAPDQRQAACQAIEPYRKHLKQNPTLNAVHACRFLSQERFASILEKTAEQPKNDIRGHFV